MKPDFYTRAVLILLLIACCMTGQTARGVSKTTDASGLVPRHYDSSWMFDHTKSVTAQSGDILYFDNHGALGSDFVGRPFDVLRRVTKVADAAGTPIEIEVSKIGEMVITEVRTDHLLGRYRGPAISRTELARASVFCVFLPNRTFTEEMFDNRTKELAGPVRKK
jgi:hypothetical protein